MRIIFTTISSFGSGTKGGGERYVSELASALNKRGHDVTIVEANRGYLSALYKKSKSGGRLTELVRNADVVHCHQLNSYGFDLGVLLGRLTRTPVVLTDHGGGTRNPGRVLGQLRLHLVDGAAWVSPYSARDSDPKSRIQDSTVIWGGGDHLQFADVEVGARRYDYGFVGRLLPHKGIHVALEALPADKSMIVAGQVRDTHYYDRLIGLSRNKKVTFALDPSDAELAQIYPSFATLVLPSVSSFEGHSYARPELLGLVALEALHFGKSVLGSDVGGLADLLHASGQVAVREGDVQAWREQLGRSHFAPDGSAEYTWARVAQRCETLYERLVSRRGEN